MTLIERNTPSTARPKIRRPGRTGKPQCGHCRKGRRGRKAPCTPNPNQPTGPCLPCYKRNRNLAACGEITWPNGLKVKRFPSLVTSFECRCPHRRQTWAPTEHRPEHGLDAQCSSCNGTETGILASVEPDFRTASRVGSRLGLQANIYSLREREKKVSDIVAEISTLGGNDLEAVVRKLFYAFEGGI